MGAPTTPPTPCGKLELQSQVDEMLRALVPYQVRVPWPEGVRGYLEQHADLIPHVPPTVARARQEFGDPAELQLTGYVDPEIDDRYVKLCVSLPEYGSDTMSRIMQVRDPLDELLGESSGWFQVTTDHRRVG